MAIVLNGKVINVATWDGVTQWTPSVGVAIEAAASVRIGDNYSGGVFSRGAAVSIREITSLEFLTRFTAQERINIRLAAETNSNVADWMDLAQSAQMINLDDDRVTAALALFSAGGIISASRIPEITA